MRRGKRQIRRPRRRTAKRKTASGLKNYVSGFRIGYGDGFKQGVEAGSSSYSVYFDGTSIIIPALNQREELERCITAVTDNTDLPYEIIVADAGSVDGTAKYLKRLAGQIR